MPGIILPAGEIVRRMTSEAKGALDGLAAMAGKKGLINMLFAPARTQHFNARRLMIPMIEVIRAAWMHYIDNRERFRAFSALSAMDDSSLKDIGISRLEIRAAIRSDADADADADLTSARR